MKTSTAVPEEIEAAVYAKAPGALSSQVREGRVRVPSGVAGVDAVTRAGFPIGVIVGLESWGRAALTVSSVRRPAEYSADCGGPEMQDEGRGALEVGRRQPPQPERSGAWHGTTAWAKAGGVAQVRTEAGESRVCGRSGRVG